MDEEPVFERVPLAETVGREFARRGRWLATAESCTGGMLGAEITGISGSSQYYRGGVVAYHDEVKKSLLGVSPELLELEGAVSEPVAREMARGIRGLLGAGYGVGITGVAGPTGGTAEKPVGLVFIAVSSDAGDIVRRFEFSGGREDVRRASAVAALDMLYDVIRLEPVPG